MSIPGWFDFAALYDRVVAEAPPGSLLIEVGVYHGKSLVHLGTAAKNADKGLRVVGVDWGRGQPDLGGKPTADAALANLVAAGLADDVPLILAPSWRAASLFDHGSAWFVFIDAGHEYADVRADIEAWLPRVRVGGVLAGHDYTESGWPGVYKAVTDVFGPFRQSQDCPTCWCIQQPWLGCFDTRREGVLAAT